MVVGGVTQQVDDVIVQVKDPGVVQNVGDVINAAPPQGAGGAGANQGQGLPPVLALLKDEPGIPKSVVVKLSDGRTVTITGLKGTTLSAEDQKQILNWASLRAELETDLTSAASNIASEEIAVSEL